MLIPRLPEKAVGSKRGNYFPNPHVGNRIVLGKVCRETYRCPKNGEPHLVRAHRET